MPLITFIRDEDFGIACAATEDMSLVAVPDYDGKSYQWKWKGLGGRVPSGVFDRAINNAIQGCEFREIWVSTNVPDFDEFWNMPTQDRVSIFCNYGKSRLPGGVPLQVPVFRLGVANIYDSVGFRIRGKDHPYSITLLVSPITDDLTASEYRVVTTT